MSVRQQANVDFSAVNVTRFRERFERQLKFEFFNAFNHAQFAAAGATIGNASAGVISSLLFGATARQIQVAMPVNISISLPARSLHGILP
jgi:hypothetical protein